MEKRRRRKEKDIIVIGTLLEKIPNFGHLTRISEIFGVSTLTIPNKAILEDDSFKAISVTAEKWLPIVEVKEPDLMTYLLLKKKLGYKVRLNILRGGRKQVNIVGVRTWIDHRTRVDEWEQDDRSDGVPW